MLDSIGKYVGGKVLAAVLGVGSVLVVIWYWRLPPEARGALWSGVRDALVWGGFAAVLPWALFWIPARVARMSSNGASALLLLAYLVVDAAFGLYLWHGRLGGAWQTGLVVVGLLCAAVYNFVVCEYLAGPAEDSL